MAAVWGVAAVSLAAWLGLLCLRGGFWRATPRLNPAKDGTAASNGRVVFVTAVIPARNEADVLPETVPTVVSQEVSGPFRAILVDDRSEDGTAEVARAAVREIEREDRLTIVEGAPLPAGWAGKVWAMAQGARQAGSLRADYLWFTDADIAHDPGVLRALTEKAEAERLDLVSLMARLRVDSAWDRLLIPAFVYFFDKLYPFRFVNDPRRRTAGAAGGCVLVRRDALEAAGGIAAIGSALIDDCALARLIKRNGGRIWLGFTSGVHSVRRYGTLRSIWDMVARSAYDQLHYSPLLLLGTVLGMAFLYAAPPLAVLAGGIGACFGIPGAIPAALFGAASWFVMAGSFVPMLDHHGAGRRFAFLLPLAGCLYTAMTISSAWRHRTGRSGSWKGRTRGAGDAA